MASRSALMRPPGQAPAKPAAKPGAKPAAKQPAAKPAAKSGAKSATKSGAKPATKPARRVSTPAERAAYWRERGDYVYYQYVYTMVRVLGRKAGSLLDVGSRDCCYLEWFDWIPRKLSIDLVAPYSSPTVEGRKGDFLKQKLDGRFDVCLCLQVLEHVPPAKAFCQRLLEVSDHLIVSVPYKWGGKTTGHVHDPVDEAKLASWMGRLPTYQVVVSEPLLTAKHRRLIAYYNVLAPGRGPSHEEFKARRRSRFL